MMHLTTCWWAARRLDRYVDADPSARLGSAEAARVERHAATCRRCSTDLAARREVREVLQRYDSRRFTDVAALERLDAMVSRLRAAGPGPA